MAAFVGTSGWQYADWRERFYPTDVPQARWLGYYADRFSTVEVNASFYRLPSRETVERWASTVPDGFVFAMKASRYLTHVRRLRDCAEPLARMWYVFQGAGANLGPVLFQLPPNLPADLERLTTFVSSLPHGLRAAFEFRHPSWRTGDVVNVLGSAGAALVHADRPGVRVDAMPSVAGWAYLRLHQGTRTSPGYARTKLRRYAEALAALEVGDAFVYFNNDTGGAAVRDASTMVHLLGERGVDVAGR